MGDSVVRMWVKFEEMVCVVCMGVAEGAWGGDGCDLASDLCKYDLRNGNLFFSELGTGCDE